MKVLIVLSLVAGAFAFLDCPANQHYESCGTACPLTCKNVNDPPSGCILMCNPGCHCDKGYVKTENGDCVKPENCATQEVCTGENEQYNECGTACPLTCDNYQNPPKACTLQCVVGCGCKEGYVKDIQGRCVLPENCPATSFSNNLCELEAETGMCRGFFPRFHFNKASGQCEQFIYGGCGGNGNNFKTREECQSSCAAQASSNNLCELEAETGMCRGFFPRFHFNKASGQCEEFIYGGCGGNGNNFETIQECQNSCAAAANEVCGENEEFSSCGTACPLTCDNLNDPPTICTLQCVVGCRCAPGFVKNAQGKCVLPEQCPAKAVCGENQEFVNCGTACPLTCDNLDNPPKFCTKQCVIGCACQKGYVKNAEGACVLPEECPSRADADLCELESEPGMCRGYFPRFHFNKASGQCEKFIYGGCGGNGNNFKTIEECQNSCGASNQVCGVNEEYTNCGTACPLTCDNLDNPPFACTKQCVIGCQCAKGFVKNAEGKCVKPSQCPSKAVCGENSRFNPCGTACPLTCDNHKNPPRFCTLQCKVGCECEKGYVKNAEGKCVLPEQCEAVQRLDRPDCDKAPEVGLCKGRVERFYYDQEAGMCKTFIYGGCGGNRNNFGSRFECLNKCGAL